MLEKYDPGLIPGTIGVVIGIILGFILEKTMIMLRFSKLRKNLKDEVEGLDQMLDSAAHGRAFDRMKDLVKEGSEMVREERNVSRICVITRYRESNEMAKLISKIETAQSLLEPTLFLEQIVVEQTSHLLETVTSHQEQTLTSHQEETSHLLQTRTSHQEQTSSLWLLWLLWHMLQTLASHLEQQNQAVAQTDTAEQTSSLPAQQNQAALRQRRGSRAANAQAVAQTDTAEEMTNEEKPMPAGLPRRLQMLRPMPAGLRRPGEAGLQMLRRWGRRIPQRR